VVLKIILLPNSRGVEDPYSLGFSELYKVATKRDLELPEFLPRDRAERYRDGTEPLRSISRAEVKPLQIQIVRYKVSGQIVLSVDGQTNGVGTW
jgi:hypothetical protein